MININKFEITERMKCSADTKLFFDDVYTNSTQTKKTQIETAQCGKSMIEMLGVLAIVGVLSVGGIAGYSKAMETINSNKRKTQFNQIFYQLEMMKNDIIRSTTAFNPAAIWNATNDIPDGLYYSKDGLLATKPGYVNATKAYYYGISVGNGGGSMEMDFYLDKRTYDKKICTDFIEVAQRYKNIIHPTYCLQVRDYSNGEGGYKEDYRGYICPKNMPLTPIQINNYCSKFTESYRFAILVHFKFK